MAAPELSDLGERLRERTQPLAPDDERYDWTHAHLCEALMVMLGQVGEIWDPPDPYPPSAPLLDANTCPDWALPWLAQFVGVSVPPGTDPDITRALIKDGGGWRRGTPAAIKATIEAVAGVEGLNVYFREREGGDAYRLEIVGAAPDIDDNHYRIYQALYAAQESQVPAGIVTTLRVIEGWDYQQMTAEGGTYAEQSAAFGTYFDLKSNDRTP